MEVIKRITLDLLSSGVPPVVEAVQDNNCRKVEAHLHAGGAAFSVPEGAVVTLRYRKPDGTAGWYDTLPDGSPAIVVVGNVVTATLAAQVLTVPGRVTAELQIVTAGGASVTTFAFIIQVAASVIADTEIISSDYYNVLTAKVAEGAGYAAAAEAAAKRAEDAAAGIVPANYMTKAEYGGSAPGIVKEADKAKLADKATASISAEETQMFRCTFGLGWSDTGGKWEQTVSCTGMKAAYNTDAPEFEPTAVQSTNEKLMEVLNILNAGKLETLEGQIHATVFEQPQSEIDIILRRAVYPEVI